MGCAAVATHCRGGPARRGGPRAGRPRPAGAWMSWAALGNGTWGKWTRLPAAP
eukprot:gene43752-15382_t